MKGKFVVGWKVVEVGCVMGKMYKHLGWRKKRWEEQKNMK
jgi:hypothetical protein